MEADWISCGFLDDYAVSQQDKDLIREFKAEKLDINLPKPKSAIETHKDEIFDAARILLSHLCQDLEKRNYAALKVDGRVPGFLLFHILTIVKVTLEEVGWIVSIDGYAIEVEPNELGGASMDNPGWTDES